jgi:hypothetical protein
VRPIAEQELLSAWDEALPQHPLDRALTLLAALQPASKFTSNSASHSARGELRALGVGERDAQLLALRERLFGPELEAFATCPQCGANLELSASVADLRTPASEGAADLDAREQVVEADGLTIRFRRVDSRDLAAVVDAPDAETARAALFTRIVIEARRQADAEAMAIATLPPGAAAAVDARLAELDAAADVLFDLVCPECDACWSAPFDPGVYLWTEIDAWARRLLRSVDTLARAYGWREADVLALGPRRRRFYLELAQG